MILFCVVVYLLKNDVDAENLKRHKTLTLRPMSNKFQWEFLKGSSQVNGILSQNQKYFTIMIDAF